MSLTLAVTLTSTLTVTLTSTLPLGGGHAECVSTLLSGPDDEGGHDQRDYDQGGYD